MWHFSIQFAVIFVHKMCTFYSAVRYSRIDNQRTQTTNATTEYYLQANDRDTMVRECQKFGSCGVLYYFVNCLLQLNNQSQVHHKSKVYKKSSQLTILFAYMKRSILFIYWLCVYTYCNKCTRCVHFFFAIRYQYLLIFVFYATNCSSWLWEVLWE